MFSDNDKYLETTLDLEQKLIDQVLIPSSGIQSSLNDSFNDYNIFNRFNNRNKIIDIVSYRY